MKPLTYEVFISYKRKTGEDFALHLKDGFEAEGIHAFLDIRDISKIIRENIEWWKYRDNALANSKVFLLIITEGIETSQEVSREISLARKNKIDCIYFRHTVLKPHIVVNLENAKLDLGDFNQTEFETKEDLLRKALRHFSTPRSSSNMLTNNGKTVYCRRCGAIAGQQTACIGVYTYHDFTSGSGIIYCRRCGVFVGQRTACTGLNTYHDFTTGNGTVYCRRCGVIAGQRSVCIGLNTYHDFVST